MVTGGVGVKATGEVRAWAADGGMTGRPPPVRGLKVGGAAGA